MDLICFLLILSTTISPIFPVDDAWDKQLDIQPNWKIRNGRDRSALEIAIDDQHHTIPLRGAPFCRLWVTHKCDCYILDKSEESNWTMAFFSYCNGTIRGSLMNEKGDSFKIFPKSSPKKEKDGTELNGQYRLEKILLINDESKNPSLDNDTLPLPDEKKKKKKKKKKEDHEIDSEPSFRRPEMDPFYGMEYIKVFFAVDVEIQKRYGDLLDLYLQSMVSLGSQYYQEIGYMLVYQGWEVAKSNSWDSVFPFVESYDQNYYQEGEPEFDIIVLFLDDAENTGQKGLGIVGLANLNSACSVIRGIYVHNFEHQVILNAITLIHEIGHTLGLLHTTSTACAKECQPNPNDRKQKQCIMNPFIGDPRKPFKWSWCSKNHLAGWKSTRFCFRKKVVSPKPICGDGLVDADEQCDCIQQECSACCDEDCKLREDKQCANGPCCDLKTCQNMEGPVCRRSRNFCDFEEKCDGQSGECPTDYVVADGYPCENSQQGGYCYDGVCGSRNDMCKWMFKKGKGGDMKCYDKNLEGTSFGACGPEFNVEWWDGTMKCEEENKYCGKIFCKVPSVGEIEITQTFDQIRPLFKIPSETECLSLAYSERFGLYYYYLPRDVTYVADGSWCGDGKMCLNETCIPLPKGCPKNCSGKPMSDSNHQQVRPGVIYQERNRNRQFRKPLSFFDLFYRRYVEVLPTLILVFIVIDLVLLAGYYFLHPYIDPPIKVPARSAIPIDNYLRQSMLTN